MLNPDGKLARIFEQYQVRTNKDTDLEDGQAKDGIIIKKTGYIPDEYKYAFSEAIASLSADAIGEAGKKTEAGANPLKPIASKVDEAFSEAAYKGVGLEFDSKFLENGS